MRESMIHEAVLSRTARTQYSFRGIPLTADDNIAMANAITIFILLLIDILERYNVPYCWRDITRLQKNLPNDTTLLYDELSYMIEQVVRQDRGLDIQLPRWWIKPLSVLVRDMDNSWKGICIRRDLNTLFSHILHLTLKDIPHDCSELSIQELTRTYTGKGDMDRLAKELSSFTFDYDAFSPRYSGGATFELKRGSGPAMKFRVPAYARARFVFAHLDPQFISDFEYTDGQPIAKLISVPKSMVKKRVITVEPTQQCFVQQGLRAILDKALSKPYPINISLENQEVNRRLALDASYTQDYVTVDLSSASDSIKMEHIMCFPPKMRRLLVAARTPYITQDGSDDQHVYYMQSFAGMGNATTFRVECMIFAAIAKMACEDSGIDVRGSVYGDDIIVPTKAYDNLVTLLTDYGFKVNATKSYASGSFRESCGMEAFNGNDITPIRIPRGFTAQTTTSIDGLKEYANALLGYQRTRRFVITKFLANRTLLASHTDYKFLISTGTNLNSKVPYKWDKDTQTYLYRVDQSLTEEIPTSDEDAAYYLTLAALARTTRDSLSMPEDRLDTTLGRIKTTYRKGWLRQS